MTIDRAKLTLLVSPLVPDAHAYFLERADIRFTTEKPQEFVDDGFQVDLLGGYERKPGSQVESHLASKDAERARAGSVGLAGAVVPNITKQIQVGLHGSMVAGTLVRVDPLLRVENLHVRFKDRSNGDWVEPVKGVSLSLGRGCTLGLVGESGCGKTTLARAILRLVPSHAGKVLFEGQSVLDLPRRSLRQLRRRMQIIFQDPGGSLNSRMRVGTIVGEPLLVHGMARGESLRRRVEQLLELCGLEPDAASRYPHAFSGGQKQRIAIARAISTEPSLVVCDEPTSALDVSVQASIINLLASLQEKTGVSYLFITHDLAVARHLCDEVALMESGRIKSCGPVEQVLEEAQAQYSGSI